MMARGESWAERKNFLRSRKVLQLPPFSCFFQAKDPSILDNSTSLSIHSLNFHHHRSESTHWSEIWNIFFLSEMGALLTSQWQQAKTWKIENSWTTVVEFSTVERRKKYSYFLCAPISWKIMLSSALFSRKISTANLNVIQLEEWGKRVGRISEWSHFTQQKIFFFQFYQLFSHSKEETSWRKLQMLAEFHRLPVSFSPPALFSSSGCCFFAKRWKINWWKFIFLVFSVMWSGERGANIFTTQNNDDDGQCARTNNGEESRGRTKERFLRCSLVCRIWTGFFENFQTQLTEIISWQDSVLVFFSFSILF